MNQIDVFIYIYIYIYMFKNTSSKKEKKIGSQKELKFSPLANKQEHGKPEKGMIFTYGNCHARTLLLKPSTIIKE